MYHWMTQAEIQRFLAHLRREERSPGTLAKYRRDLLAFAARLQLALETQAPGICRPLDLRCERFNQHATPMSLLVEVGTVGDTLARALPAAQSLGRALARLLTQEQAEERKAT